MSKRDTADIAAKFASRYQELRERASFVQAARTLLRSQAVPDLICSSRRFLKANPDTLVERISELHEKSSAIARACSVVLSRQKNCRLTRAALRHG